MLIYLQDHTTLIHFMLSIMFAQPHQLGFDPTITPAPAFAGNSERQYDIQVRSKDGKVDVFRTEKILSNVGAEALRGRGTRVWRVRKLVDGLPTGDGMVLKDSWIDDDRIREGDILAKMRASASDPIQKEIFETHFLHVECHGDVYIGNHADHTGTLLRRGAQVPDDSALFSLERTKSRGAAEKVTKPPIGSGITQETRNKEDEPIEFDDKAHYRIVFKEVATGIDSLVSGPEIVVYLRQVLLGKLLFFVVRP